MLAGQNLPADLLYSKLAAVAGGLILSANLLGLSDSDLTRYVGFILAGSGAFGVIIWRVLVWLSGKFLDRVDIINGLPEKLAQYEDRAIERDREWVRRLGEWEGRFQRVEDKQDASMKLQGAIVDGLVRQIENIAAFQRREAERMDKIEEFLRELPHPPPHAERPGF